MPHTVVPTDGRVIFQPQEGPWLSLSLPNSFTVQQDGVVSDFTLSSGQSATFVLQLVDPDVRKVTSLGETLGNFPQAFTHLRFISAAFNLDRALGNGV